MAEHRIPMPHVIQSPEVDFSIPINFDNLKTKTILITGGASGLGAAMFELWAKQHACLIIGDINETMGLALVAKVRQITGNENLHFIHLDVTDWVSLLRFFKEAKRLSPHHGIDCVVANAGISDPEENRGLTDPPDLDRMDNPPPPSLKTVDVNLIGVMWTTHLALSYLSRNPGSDQCSTDVSSGPRDRHLLLIASIAGVMPVPGVAVYSASKHGVVGLFRALRATAPVRHGVRINMLCPYFVQTPILGAVGSAVLSGAALAEIEDVVDAATRATANQTIIGRALAIGPKIERDEAVMLGLARKAEEAGPRAVWDIHGEDFEQSDVFIRRIMAVTNLVSGRKGIWTVMQELASSIYISLMRSLGCFGLFAVDPSKYHIKHNEALAAEDVALRTYLQLPPFKKELGRPWPAVGLAPPPSEQSTQLNICEPARFICPVRNPQTTLPADTGVSAARPGTEAAGSQTHEVLPNKNQREPTKPSTTTSLDAPPSILGTAPDLSPSPEVELVPTGTPAIPTFPKIIHISSLSPPQRAAVGNSSEEEYQLVGLGIRTVSFLGIQVYVVGLYIAVSDIATLQERLIRTLDPVATALVAGEKGKLKDLLLDPQRGEDVWNSILQDGGLRTAFRIVPVRNTDYMHLRDGWVRSLTARTQHFASSKKDTSFDDESFGNALNEFKAMWGGGARKSVPKGEVLLLTRDAAGKMTAWHEDKVGNGLRLGGIEDERISRLIWLGYLGGKNVSSEGARQSVVDGVIEFVERPIGTVATQVI